MKKLLVLPTLALIVSCSSKPSYTKMVETTYNFNSSAVNLILESDSITSDFVEIVKGDTTFVMDLDGKFIMKLLKNSVPNTIEMINTQGVGSKIVEERGFKISNKKVGDTLIIQYFPSKETPLNVLKFGTEYKFYN